MRKIVVELEEFVALRNSKTEDEAELFISARTRTVRLPYERFSRDIKRICILIATINDAIFLGDFSGAVAQAVYLYENDLHDFTVPNSLKEELNFVIQTHKNDNIHIQNFLDFMEWKDTMSDNPDVLCSAEFTSKYVENQ